MSENDSNPRPQANIPTPHEVCAAIRNENFNPLSLFFPIADPCTGCMMLTGGNPKLMATVCPLVIARLEKYPIQTEKEVIEGEKVRETHHSEKKTE